MRCGQHRSAASLGVAALCLVLVVSGCVRAVDGTAVGHPVADADLSVRGDSGGAFDTEVKNALSDVMAFWRKAYPKISGGKALPPLKGALYSIDGFDVLRTRSLPVSAKSNACLRRHKLFIVDNAAYCELDDSILWDRSPGHLLPLLTKKYGAALTALVFAHEFGHAIQKRIAIPRSTPTIDAESQADCAAGAFIAAAMHGVAPHFRLTSAQVDSALDGFLQFRDLSVQASENASHGDGFDRLNALQHGITDGPTYCFSKSYFSNVHFTERSYTDADFALGTNEPLSDLLTSKGGLFPDLNRFWTQAGNTVHHKFATVRVKLAGTPPCALLKTVQFGYCANSNTVYYSTSFAQRAYNSMSTLDANRTTGNVTIKENQPADYALGTMFAIAWGMAARDQFFGQSIGDAAGLSAAICYAGAYSANINPPSDPNQNFELSPPDLDEATSAVLNLVGLDSAFGTRGTTGLERVTSFVTGYDKGLHSC